ncbi:MAG TPA: extracellular solute-binding protein, partial [Anaerolineales bacterium]|nr:extracellular solute-binding protein [Anaerolineales bacterium]
NNTIGIALEPGDKVINGYDAALAILAAIQRSDNGETASNRERIYQALLRMDNAENGVQGIIGPIFFEPSGNISRAARFGTYQNGAIVSANTQFEPISAPNEIRDLRDQVRKGRILTVNGGYVYRANIVYAGVDLLGIDEIDIKTSTYKTDFYLWFRYRPNEQDNEFKPEEFVFANAQSVDEPVLIREDENADGTILKTYRVAGVFKNQFDFHNYPFDHQRLIVEFRNQNATTSFIQYVVDRIGMRYRSETDLLENFRANGAFDSLFGWQAKGAHVEQDVFPTFSTLGNPQYFDRSVSTDYSLINIEVDIQRDSLQYIFKSLLPLLLTLILAYITFFLPLGHEERLAVGSTALLTTAFFHLTLADALPEIGYTVAMEYLFYASYVMSALIVLLETLSIRLEKRGEDEKKKADKDKFKNQRENLNMLGRFIFPAILIVVIGAGFFIYGGSIQLGPKEETNSQHLVDLIIESGKSNPLANTSIQTPISSGNEVKLTFSTWRPEDSAQIQVLLDKFREFAVSQGRNISIEYRPVMSVNYDSILDLQLGRGEGPDLFYVRPFSVDGNITKYLESLNDLPIEEKFESTKSIPWRSKAGNYYAVPFVGVVQGVYYNKELFEKYGIDVPITWGDFLIDLQTIKKTDPKIISIANALNQTEDSEMFMSIAANFLGGPDGRAQLMRTDGLAQCYDSRRVINAFQAIEDLKPYLYPSAGTINSQTSKELFFSQNAVMLFGGSWDLKKISDEASFDWDVFAVPAPALRETYVIFQPDVGIGINKDSLHQKEARMFLEWLMTEEAVDLASQNLAGFYTLNDIEVSKASDANDAKFLNLVNNYPTDIRWMYTEISNKTPGALEIVRRDLYEMVTFDLAPDAAAQRLQDGLGEWYEPAQNCK